MFPVLKKIDLKRVIASACAFVIGFSLLPISKPVEVEAATNGVRQSRYIADIEEFPVSYQDGLRSVKAAYPEATFIYFDTGLDWYNDLLSPYNEMLIGRNLIPASSPTSWKRVDPEVYNMETDEYKQIEPGWNAASQAIIEYYMDPRNFLTTQGVFQFSELTYNSSQTVAGTEILLDGTFMDSDNGAVVEDDEGNMMTYAEALVEIGRRVNVNPYMLASRIIQEQGSRGTVLCNGAPTFQDGAYAGCYNYFNVSAYGSSTESIIQHGLAYAQSHGWTSRWRGLLGGADVVSSSYVGKGLDTLYLQHFNVVAGSNGRVSYAPYMANLRAPESESRNFYRASQSTDEKMVFIIPVYDNMPGEPCYKPDGDGNGNYWLKNLAINGERLPDFDTETGKYTVILGEDVGSVTIDAEAYRENTISLNGKLEKEKVSEYSQIVTLNFGYNEFTLAVKAENGNVKAYTLEIIRDNGEPFYSFSKFTFDNQYAHLNAPCNVDRISRTTKLMNCYFTVTDKDGNWKSAEEMVATGDSLIVRDENDKVILEKQVMLRGDLDGNGDVNELDVSILVQDRLKLNKLSQTLKNAADIDKNERHDAQDIITLNQLVSYHTQEVSHLSLLINSTRAIKDEPFDVSLQVPTGTYVMEGYLTYNNNFLRTVDVDNTGSIHFIVVNGNVLFENGKNIVSFLPEIANDSIEIDARCTYAYDCNAGQDMYMDISTAVVQAEPSGLTIRAENSGTLAYHEGPAVRLIVGRLGNPEIKNINVTLPQDVETGYDKSSLYIEELTGDTTYPLYVKENRAGNYSLPIEVTYELNGKFIKEDHVLYYQINNCNCAESPFTKVNEFEHKKVCKYCKTETVATHQFTQKQDTFLCVDCGYETKFSIVVTAEEFEAGKASSINVVVLHEEEEFTGSNVKYTWYLDETLSSQTTATWSSQLPDINEHTVTCVVDLGNGVVLLDRNKVVQKEQDFQITKIQCNAIVAKSNAQYEYRIGDGDWQASSTFKKLEPNTTYAVSRRLKDDPDKVETINVTTVHTATYKAQKNATCTSNETEKGWCIYCSKSVERELPGTILPHSFTSYEVKQTATCQSGSTWKSLCDYECGTEHVIENKDIGGHVFTEYNYNNNATCTANGTQTAQCMYGCDAWNTIEAPDTVQGHFYKEYIEDADGNRVATCTHGCGTSNKITTSKTVIEYIDVSLGKMHSGQTGMTTVEINTKGAIFDNYLLKADDTEITRQTARGKINRAQIYVLSQISFIADTGYVFDNEVKLYINGELIDCPAYVEDGVLYFNNVGRFKT